MAKENYVSLRGQLRNEVKYIANESGELIQAIFKLTVLRRDIKNRAGNFEPKIDHPIIMTSDKELIRICQTLKLEDIVEIKGTFKTQHVTKHRQCPCCNTVNAFEATMQTINPIYIGRCMELDTNLEGMDQLRKCAEISNIVKVIGRVCTPDDKIIFGETDRGNLFAKYQLAVNRRFYDVDSVDEEDHSDYPVIYSYDSVAEEDQAMIKQGALMYVDGYLHTMTFDSDVQCCECNEPFKIKLNRMNITPYAVEYLRDYKNDVLESTHKKVAANEYEEDVVVPEKE